MFRFIDAFMLGVGAGIVAWEVFGFIPTLTLAVLIALAVTIDTLRDVLRERHDRRTAEGRWQTWTRADEL